MYTQTANRAGDDDFISAESMIKVHEWEESYKEEIDNFKTEYKKAREELVGYLHDLSVELSNFAMGELFDRKALRRNPSDPSVLVISSDPEDMKRLNKYFDDSES